jgi:HD superfamily phosphodiesterase
LIYLQRDQMESFTPKQLTSTTIGLLDAIMTKPIKVAHEPERPTFAILWQCPGADKYLSDFIVELINEGMTRLYAKHEEGHGVSHALDVLRNAIEISKNMELGELQQMLFPLVMLGHDILDHKMIARGTMPNPGDVKQFYIEILKVMFNQLGGTSYNLQYCASNIKKIHLNCSWSKRATSKACDNDILRLILQDADWLEAIGGIGLKRCWSYQTDYWKRNDMKNADYDGPIDKQEIYTTMAKHIDEKLFHVAAGMNFDYSRDLANGLNDVIARFYTTYMTNV